MFAHFTRLAALAAIGIGTSLCASAQDKFPSKPVRIVVPFVAGSQVDLVAREIGRRLQDSWGQPVIVDNRPGAGGTVGSRAVATAEPDGHTLMLTSASHAINPTLYKKLPNDTLRDFTGVTFATSVPNVLVVAPSLGEQGVVPAPNSPADFDKFIASEIERLGMVVKTANISLD